MFLGHGDTKQCKKKASHTEQILQVPVHNFLDTIPVMHATLTTSST